MYSDCAKETLPTLYTTWRFSRGSRLAVRMIRRVLINCPHQHAYGFSSYRHKTLPRRVSWIQKRRNIFVNYSIARSLLWTRATSFLRTPARHSTYSTGIYQTTCFLNESLLCHLSRQTLLMLPTCITTILQLSQSVNSPGPYGVLNQNHPVQRLL